MNATEASELVALMALYDNRKASDPDIVAWLKVIGDLGYDDCESAVIAHYQESRERIMPADVRTRVKAMRRDRLAREVLPAPHHELTDEPGRYAVAFRAGLKRIADGFSIRRAIEPGPAALSPPVAEVRKALPAALPPEERHLAPEEIARRQVAASRIARGVPAAAEPDDAEPAA